jgi:hypothetical protein
MKIEAIAPGPGTPSQESPQQSSRERAIAQLMGSAPSVNQNSVSPEEMGAVKDTSSERSDSSVSPQGDSEVSEAPKAEKEPALSAQYANLARKEKALRQAAQKLKAEQAAFEASRQPQKPAEPAFDPSKYIQKDRFSKDPLAALAEAGLSYDQITEMVLNQPKSDPALQSALDQIRAEMQALKDAQEEGKKTYAEQQQAQYKQAVNQIRNEAKQLIASDPYFETIAKTNSLGDVVELIERTFKEEGTLMSVEDAAREVEDFLVEQLTGYTSRIDKLKKKFQTQVAPAESAQKQPDPKQPQMKTLTNAVGTTRQLSAKERAILAFKGESKS